VSEQPHERVRHVVVVGLMAAGKTTVGRALAGHLGWPFDDSDDSIEAATGMTVKALRASRGVDVMREAESNHLLAALDGPGPLVVAAAAGVVEDGRCLDALRRRDVAVIWLRGSPAVLAERFGSSAHRPLYGKDPATFLAEQAAERSPRYASLDPIVVDVDGRSPGEVVAAAIAGLEAHLRR
jgi:shikimate kinase